MTRGSILEYIDVVKARHYKASEKDKMRIPDEFVSNTGYHGKSAIRVLGCTSRTTKVNRRCRPKKYHSGLAVELKYSGNHRPSVQQTSAAIY